MPGRLTFKFGLSSPANPRRAVVELLMGVALLGFALLTVWRPQVPPSVRIPLPIAGGEGFPLPLAYWLGIALYAWAYGWLFDLSVEERWLRGVRLGFGLHLLLLLADLPSYLVDPARTFSSKWYALYSQAVWGLILAGGAVAASWMLRSWKEARSTDPHLFLFPLLVGYGTFWVISLHANPLWTILATAASIVWLAATAWATERWREVFTRWVLDERVFLLAIFVVSLGVRLFYTSRVMTNLDFLNTGSDGPLYDQLAWNLAQGQASPEQHGYPLLVPGYVYFVALVYWLGGRSYFLVCAVQSVLGAVACLLTYAIAKHLFGTTTARIASAFATVDFPMVFAAAALGHQGVDLFLSSLLLWVLIQYGQAPQVRAKWPLGIGLLLGWATATREPNVVFWLFLVGWFLLVMRRKLGMRDALAHAGWVTTGFLVVVLPFVYAELIHAERMMPGRLRSFQCQMVADFFIDTQVSSNPMAECERLSRLLLDEPGAMAALSAKNIVPRFAALLLNQDFGGFDPVFLVRGSSYYYGMWFYAYVLVLVGFGRVMWEIIRGSPQSWGMWLVVGYLASRTSVHLVLESAYRHRSPLDPFLIMLATYGLTWALRVGTRERRRGD